MNSGFFQNNISLSLVGCFDTMMFVYRFSHQKISQPFYLCAYVVVAMVFQPRNIDLNNVYKQVCSVPLCLFFFYDFLNFR